MSKRVPKRCLTEYKDIIGKTVTVTIDRPIGANLPKHPEVIYPINYGYVEGIPGGDGEFQDVYILGEDSPLKTFTGVIIAIVHRFDDNECKWVATSEYSAKIHKFSKTAIRKLIKFQEQFHESRVLMQEDIEQVFPGSASKEENSNLYYLSYNDFGNIVTEVFLDAESREARRTQIAEERKFKR